MQTRNPDKSIYKLYSNARTQECLDAYRKKYETHVCTWETLKKEGVCRKICEEITGVSRASYYRHKKILEKLNQGIFPPSKKPHSLNKPKWGESEKQLVLQIRRDNPTYGKLKVAIILKRDHGKTISESTVGRILKHLLGKYLIQKSPSARWQKKKRLFSKGYSKPWKYKEYNKMKLGERIQIDHMTATKNGICLKHFQAWDRRSKYIDANVYSNAKASSAKRFLIEFVENCPFDVLSIQVDGGSEFRAEFEEACEALAIPLIVLPPAKPKYNGGVERGNRIFREEFYEREDLLADSIDAFRCDLRKAVKKYNTYRPHAHLDGLTPMEYVNNNSLEGVS